MTLEEWTKQFCFHSGGTGTDLLLSGIIICWPDAVEVGRPYQFMELIDILTEHGIDCRNNPDPKKEV